MDGGQPLNLTRPTLSWHTGDGSVGSEAHVTGGEWNEAAAVRRWKFILDEGTANEEVVTPDPIEDGFGGEWQLFITEEMLGESERVPTALVRGYTEDLSDFVEVAALGALTLPPLHKSEDFSNAAFDRYAEPTGWFYVDPVNGADETPPVGGYETVAQAQSNPLRWISNAIPRLLKVLAAKFLSVCIVTSAAISEKFYAGLNKPVVIIPHFVVTCLNIPVIFNIPGINKTTMGET